MSKLILRIYSVVSSKISGGKRTSLSYPFRLTPLAQTPDGQAALISFQDKSVNRSACAHSLPSAVIISECGIGLADALYTQTVSTSIAKQLTIVLMRSSSFWGYDTTYRLVAHQNANQ